MWYIMADKLDSKQDYLNKNIVKIWCPDRDNFQCIKVCDSNCKKKYKCKAFRDYSLPKLFKDKFSWAFDLSY
jgi:hypothetical protein